MRFEPLSDDQIIRMGLMEKGIYPFEVISAENTISKSNNEMIKLQLRIWDKEGSERILYDYLLSAFIKKIKHFSDVTGLQDKYQNGNLEAEDCLGKSGNVLIGVQEDKTNTYPPKNSVIDYVAKPENNMVNKPLVQEKDLFDDQEIPF